MHLKIKAIITLLGFSCFTLLTSCSEPASEPPSEKTSLADQISCEAEPQNGSWYQGIGSHTLVTNLANEINPEFQPMIQTLDQLPTKISETELIEAIGKEPKKRFSSVAWSTMLEWEIQGKNSTLGVIFNIYSGCIYKTAIGESINGKPLNGSLSYFHRRNKITP